MAFEVFIAYSHNDQMLRDKLETHLSLLKNQGRVSVWYDGDIQPGTQWERQIVEHLHQAQIILLLISPDFLASHFCYSVEMQLALSRQQVNTARVLPIILRPTDLQDAPFAHLQILPDNGKPVTKWSNRDEAFTAIVRGLRKVLEDFEAHSPSSSISLLASTNPTAAKQFQMPYWQVPLPRNLYFTGRDDVLKRLHDILNVNQPVAITQPHAISGLGGIGKTQIALEYAYRYGQDYQAVFWLRAESREMLIGDMTTIAHLLNLPEQQAQEQDLTIQAVKIWLQTHLHWLLILDNADDLSVLRDLLPLQSTGHLLLTTRSHASSGVVRIVAIDRMKPEEGMAFLLRRAGMLDSDTALSQISSSLLADAQSLVEAVDGLPLALDQAGAYLEETGCSLSDYLSLLHDQHHQYQILSKRGGLTEYHPDPVSSTWSLSFEKVKAANPVAVDLLCVCAFLAADAIPETLLTSRAVYLGPLLQTIRHDSMILHEAIGALLKYSLVRREIGTHLLSIHRLLQAIFKASMDEQTQQQWAERVVIAMSAAFSDITFEKWLVCQQYLPHALACASTIEQYNMRFPVAGYLLNQIATYLKSRGQYLEALPLYRRALAIYEQALGPSHPDTITILSNVAVLHKHMGNYSEALPLYQRALTIYEQTLGSSHSSTATGLNNLAELYESMGNYPEALPLYQRALAISQRALGPSHPKTARILNNLAALYQSMDNYTAALPLYQNALAIREQALGPSHPDTAQSLNNLAFLYRKLGNYTEALPLYQRALAIRELALGPSHPDTAQSLNNLALLYKAMGNYTEALPLLQRALTIKEQALGRSHPSMATSLNNLAALYESIGNYTEALPLSQRALTIYEQALGPSHPHTITSISNLAKLHESMGNYTQALALYQRALVLAQQALGPSHIDTLTIQESTHKIEQEIKKKNY